MCITPSPNDKFYVVVSTGTLNVRSGLAISGPIVRRHQSGDILKGVLVRRSAEGHKRLQLEDGNWASIQDSAGEILLSKVDFIEHQYIVVCNGSLKVHSGPANSSSIVRRQQAGDILKGVLVCRNAEGHKRVKLQDGTWASTQDSAGTILLSKVEFIEHQYIVVCHGPLNVRSGPDNSNPIVRRQQVGDILKGVLVCRSAVGRKRVQLEDGNWASIQDSAGEILLSKVDFIEHQYVVVCQGALNVRRGPANSSPIVRRQQAGDILKGVLVCRNAEGHRRVKLEDGNWVSMQNSAGENLLSQLEFIEQQYIVVRPLNVRSGPVKSDPIVRRHEAGDILKGVLVCRNAEFHKRVQLEDGNWASAQNSEGTILLEATDARMQLHSARRKVNLSRFCGLSVTDVSQCFKATSGGSFALTRVELLQNEHFASLTSAYLEILERHQSSQGIFNPLIESDLQKTAAITHLQGLFQTSRLAGGGLSKANILLVWYGPSEESAAWSIGEQGFAPLSQLNPGYYGSGRYGSAQSEYACMYASEYPDPKPPGVNGDWPVLLCAGIVGAAYPITPCREDFPSGPLPPVVPEACAYSGLPLRTQFDTHFVPVSSHDFLPVEPARAAFHEIVFREDAQLLPLALVWFKKAL